MDPRFYFDDHYMERTEDDVIGEELITLPEAKELIFQSIASEKEDEMFYQQLLQQAPSAAEKEIIAGIRDDEKKHRRILRKIYQEITDQMVTDDMMIQEMNYALDYEKNLQKALFGELAAVQKYRKIMANMAGHYYPLLMAIMSDELRHANMYNFLLCKKRDYHAK